MLASSINVTMTLEQLQEVFDRAMICGEAKHAWDVIGGSKLYHVDPKKELQRILTDILER